MLVCQRVYGFNLTNRFFTINMMKSFRYVVKHGKESQFFSDISHLQMDTPRTDQQVRPRSAKMDMIQTEYPHKKKAIQEWKYVNNNEQYYPNSAIPQVFEFAHTRVVSACDSTYIQTCIGKTNVKQ